jgi:quercetin dioxygenase-like cupin family protein
MKHFKTSQFLSTENPNPRERYRVEILTSEHSFKDLGGLLGVLPAGCSIPYHFHKERESVLMALSGEAIEIVEGEELRLREGDVICISAGEMHGLKNTSNKEFRYIEFFTYPPASADFIELKSL